MGVFGEDEPVIYRPSAGPSFTLADAVFDEAYLGLEMIDDAKAGGVNTATPVLGVRLALFPAPPVQGDMVFITRVNSTYVVRDVRPDGHGEAKLMLNFVSSP